MKIDLNEKAVTILQKQFRYKKNITKFLKKI